MWNHHYKKPDFIPLGAGKIEMSKRQGDLVVFLDHVDPQKRQAARESLMDPPRTREDYDNCPVFSVSRKGFQFYESTRVYETVEIPNTPPKIVFHGSRGFLAHNYSVLVKFE